MASATLSAGFLPDQISTVTTSSLTYTSNPWSLLLSDIGLLFSLTRYLPLILKPFFTSHPLDELYLSWGNIYNLVFQAALITSQLLFLLSLIGLLVLGPFIPLTYGLIYIIGFVLINHLICKLLNGNQPTFLSTPSCLKTPNHTNPHPNERWIFLNGVAGSHHWMTLNLTLLSTTFQRPILGVLNPSAGVIFDLLQCLIQRDFGYATQDIRNAYVSVKGALYEEGVEKVVFIVHSQGAIEGGLIVDWLLDEVPQELLRRLEVYSFGNAANHFSNPARGGDGVSGLEHVGGGDGGDGTGNATGKLRDNGKVIGHIEHYANSGDFVSQWGVLHFAHNTPPRPPMTLPTSSTTSTSTSTSTKIPTTVFAPTQPTTFTSSTGSTSRKLKAATGNKQTTTNTFMGRVFVRPGTGHLLNQHYLDKMFTLDASGKVAENNEFMDMVVEFGDVRGGNEVGGKAGVGGRSGGGVGMDVGEQSVLIGEVKEGGLGSGEGSGNGSGSGSAVVRVRDVSRLWMYRNGGVPDD